MKLRVCLSVLLFLFVSACSTNAPSNHQSKNVTFRPEKINEVVERKIVHISRGFVATYKGGLLNKTIKLGLLEGEYVAVHKDDKGLYYQGPGWCVYQFEDGGKRGNTMRGGLYIPYAGAEIDPVVYWNTNIGGIYTVTIDSDGMPILTKDQKDEAARTIEQLSPQTAINAGSIVGAAGVGLGVGLIGAFTHGTIGFLPVPDEYRYVIRELMKYVDEKP